MTIIIKQICHRPRNCQTTGLQVIQSAVKFTTACSSFIYRKDRDARKMINFSTFYFILKSHISLIQRIFARNCIIIIFFFYSLRDFVSNATRCDVGKLIFFARHVYCIRTLMFTKLSSAVTVFYVHFIRATKYDYFNMIPKRIKTFRKRPGKQFSFHP